MPNTYDKIMDDLKRTFASVPERLAMIESMDHKLESEIAGYAETDPAVWEAVTRLEDEEEKLKAHLAAREITTDQYLLAWSALMDETPHEVMVASIKKYQAMAQALSKRSAEVDA